MKGGSVNRFNKSLTASFLSAALAGMLLLGAVFANSQTVAELAKQPEAQQREVIAGIISNSVKNLTSRTDRNGKPKHAQEYEEHRALANMVRAFFDQDPNYSDQQPPGPKTILLRIKKRAVESPQQTVVDVMAGLVDSDFKQFYLDFLTADQKAIWAQKSDNDQVKLFRLNIELYENEKLYQRTIKELQDEDAALIKQMAETDEITVVLPDGRSVYRDKNGALWAVSGPSSDGTKLEGKEKEMAERLGDCKARRGIKNGREALAACREEVGKISGGGLTAQPHPEEPSPAPVPPASTVPPIDPNDDPIGPGGFITPPGLASRPAPERAATKDVVAQVCVSVTLEDRGWASPQRTVKMEAFETATKKMIRELALSNGVDAGTQYTIVDKFISFDPATTDPRSLVRVVDWASGVHDCPASNHPYELDVKTRQRSESVSK